MWKIRYLIDLLAFSGQNCSEFSGRAKRPETVFIYIDGG